MSDFSIISFAELMRYGGSEADMGLKDICAVQECQVPNRGVYIQDINGKLWETEEWDNSVKPNAIAVLADESKFLIALAQSKLQMSDVRQTEIDRYMFGMPSFTLAISDYNGAENTAKIMQMQPSTGYAAGYCNAFIFPDGKTRGYLPSLGQLKLARKNKGEIEAALNKCGGTAMEQSIPFWSSTFWGVYGGSTRSCWQLYWGIGYVSFSYLSLNYYVRPFADF